MFMLAINKGIAIGYYFFTVKNFVHRTHLDNWWYLGALFHDDFILLVSPAHLAWR